MAYSSSRAGWVIDGVDAGHELLSAELEDDRVEQLEHLGRRQVQTGIGANRCAQLTHQARGTDSASGDVADHQSGAAGADVDRVVPIAADPRALNAGLVIGGDLEVLGLELVGWQQAALQRVGDLVLPLGRLARRRRRGDRLLGFSALR